MFRDRDKTMNNSLPRNIYLVTAAEKTMMAPNETGSEYKPHEHV